MYNSGNNDKNENVVSKSETYNVVDIQGTYG